MLLVQKTLPEARFIVTISEKMAVPATNIHMKIHSDFTKVTYDIELGQNTSSWKSRYDEFKVPMTVFQDFLPGFYNYTIEADDLAVEEGMLRVMDLGQVEQPLVEIPEETQDDFLVYDPE
ncbi:MAG: hypothetical protein EOO97_00060 [Pedobacter sp.]|nr:MAG: hypothetical protein EOO97_00060 [Pedobacter sp.]